MSEQQQSVREWVRSEWPRLLQLDIEEAIREAQELDAAVRVANRLWPNLPVDDIIRLDQADRTLLRRGPNAIPGEFTALLRERLELRAARELLTALPGNKYAHGKRLGEVIRQEVAAGKDISRMIDWAYNERNNDDFTRAGELREMVLGQLSTLAAAELAKLGPNDPDAEPKRRLKILTALATPGGTVASRTQTFQALKHGHTAAYPFVVKYVGAGAVPSIQSFEEHEEPILDGFCPELIARFPGSELVRDCLDRYIRREGVLTRFMDPQDEISEQVAQAWRQLDAFVPRHAGGIFMPKEVALAENRRDRFRLPDGIACSLGIAILLESLLRQVAFTHKWGGTKMARAADMVKRIADKIRLAPDTLERLNVIFDQRSLSLRDAMSHAAFFADEEGRVDAVVGGLSHTLAAVMRDLAAEKVLAAALAGPRWDEGDTLEPKLLALIDEQYGSGFNLVDQMRDDEARAHVFKVLASATPDKRLLGSAAFLLWISGQHDDHVASASDDAQQFAALFGSLVTLEELLRALYEANHQSVLRVTLGNGVVRCHLSMLDNQAGELLETDRLKKLFQHYGIEEKCLQSFMAVKAVRDLAFHGCWGALPKPWARYTHLAVKLIFTLCSIAHFKSQQIES